MEKNMEYYTKISSEVMLQNLRDKEELVGMLKQYYLKQNKRDICIIASGSSLNASMAAEPFMRKVLGHRVDCISPTEYISYKCGYYNDSFKILISQSGCSTNIIEAAKLLNKEEEIYVALTGNLDGDLKEYADILLEYGVGNEIVDYVTLGMNTLIEFLMIFALETAKEIRSISADDYNQIVLQMEKSISANKCVFNQSEKKIDNLKNEFMTMDKVIIVSDYSNMGIIREGSLKFQETLKVPALFYECEEYIHGPNMQLTPEYSVFFIDVSQNDNRIQEVYEATKEITERVYLITNKRTKEDNRIISVSADVIAELTPLFTAIPFQYISAHLTPEKNNFKCHPLFEKFETKIHCKTDDYDEIMKNKVKKDKEML